MKGDFSRPPRWSASYPGKTAPIGILAQQGQPITDWMFNMALRLVQNELENVVQKLSTTNFHHGKVTFGADGKTPQAVGEVYITGKRVEIVEQQALEKAVANNKTYIEGIVDACDLSQLTEDPDFAMLQMSPLVLRYVSHISQDPKVPLSRTCPISWTAIGSTGNETYRVVVVSTDDTPGKAKSTKHIKWAAQNAQSVIRLQRDENADATASASYTVHPKSMKLAQSVLLKGKYGEIEVRDKEYRLLPNFEQVPQRLNSLGPQGQVEFDPKEALPKINPLTKDQPYQFWLRVWDGVASFWENPDADTPTLKKKIKLTLLGRNNCQIDLEVPEFKDFANLLPGDYWLIVTRDDIEKGTNDKEQLEKDYKDKSRTVYFRTRSDATSTLKKVGSTSDYIPNEASQAFLTIGSETPNKLVESPNTIETPPNTLSLPPIPSPGRLPIRSLGTDTTSKPLRQWLSSVTLDEVANLSVSQLREKVLKSVIVVEQERDLFETELRKLHGSAVELAQGLRRGAVHEAIV